MKQVDSVAYEGDEGFAFASYSHKDELAVMPIVHHMAQSGVRTWYDQGINPGEDWPEVIATHLEACDAFIAFVSESFLNSHNCLREFNYAIAQNKPLLVVFLEDTALTPAMRMQMASTQALYLKDCVSPEGAARQIAAFAIPKISKASPSKPEPAARKTLQPKAILVAAAVALALVLAGVTVHLVARYDEDGGASPYETTMATANPALSPSQAIQVVLTLDSDLSAKDYTPTLNMLKERLDVFAGQSRYDMYVNTDKITLNIPKSCFDEDDIVSFLRCYLTRKINFYLYANDQESGVKPIPVPRDALESVTIVPGPIDGIDPSQFSKPLPDKYDAVRVEFTEQFAANELAQAREKWGDGLFLAQDLDPDINYYYYFTTVADAENALLIVDPDQSFNPNINATIVHNLTHSPLPCHLSITINLDTSTEWEDPSAVALAGANQVAVDSLDGRLCTLAYASNSSYRASTNGERIDMDEALKARFDAMGVSYAFGHDTERRDGSAITYSVIKLAADKIACDTPALFAVSSSYNCHLFSKGTVLHFTDIPSEDWQIKTGADGSSQITISPPAGKNPSESEKQCSAFFDKLKEGDTVYFTVNNAVAFKGTYASLVDGATTINDLRMYDGTSLDAEEGAWMSAVYNACLDTVHLMPDAAEFDRCQITENGEICEDQHLYDPYEQEKGDVTDLVKGVAPDAGVTFSNSSCNVVLHLPIDANLAGAIVENTNAIIDAVDLDRPYYDQITIFFVDEDNATNERARLRLSRLNEFATGEPYYSLSSVFANGRIEQYKDDILSAIEQDETLGGFESDITRIW